MSLAHLLNTSPLTVATSKGKLFLAICCLLNEVQVLEIFSVSAACSAKITLLIMTLPSIMDVALACRFAALSFRFFTKAQHGELVCTEKTKSIFLLSFFLYFKHLNLFMQFLTCDLILQSTTTSSFSHAQCSP